MSCILPINNLRALSIAQRPSVYRATVVIHDDVPIFSLTSQHNRHGTSCVDMDPRYSLARPSSPCRHPRHPLTSIDTPVLSPPAPLSFIRHPHGELDLDDRVQPPDCLFRPACP